MKDQYVADINDFYKYQMLRISRDCFASVLIAWMLTEADGKADGGRIGYLEDATQRTADPELFDELGTLVRSGARSVAAVERCRALSGCEFDPRPMPQDHRRRMGYFRALAGRADAESLVFFDPDNGLEVPSVPKHRRGAERYLFWDELGLVRDAGASALIYQHFPRVDRARYLDSLLARLQTETGEDHAVFAVHSSLVAFLFAVRADRAEPLRAAVSQRCADSDTLSFVSRKTTARARACG